MPRRLVVLFCLICLLTAGLATLGGPVVAGATLLVDDEVTCDDSDGAPFYCTIQAAVDDAVSSTTIHVNAGTYDGCGVYVVEVVDKDLTIDGAGQGLTIIDGLDTCGGMRVTDAVVTVSDLTVTNAFASGSGAGFVVLKDEESTATLFLVDVTVEEANATVSGAGIYVSTSNTLNILRTTIASNTTSGNGAGILLAGGGATAVITDSLIIDNHSGGDGGGLWAGASGNITIATSLFEDNSASSFGGGVRIDSFGATINITDSEFNDNTAAAGGGAALDDGNITIDRSLFQFNETNTGDGGGILHENTANLLVTNTTFFLNTAAADGGGAEADGSFVNTTFVGNAAGGDAGGLGPNTLGSSNVANSIFFGNSATNAPDCLDIYSEGHNHIFELSGCLGDGDMTGNVTGVNPLFTTFADNGGATWTVALSVHSPARNAGNTDGGAWTPGAGDWGCTTSDQRAVTRGDVACDVGAYEVGRVIRYAGATRYETAGEIALGEFTAGLQDGNVYVATGLNFPDGLAGAVAAAGAGSPLLLVQQNAVPARTVAELLRLAPDNVYVFGGSATVSDSVLTELASYAIYAAGRLSGADRYETAVNISAHAFPAGSEVVFVATGLNFPDALAAGPVAAELGGPVLLVPGTSLPQVVADEITRLDPDQIFVVGGNAAVSTGVQTALDALLPSDPAVIRVSGADRYATSVALSNLAFAPEIDHIYIATGLNFPDALAGAAAAGYWGAPVLLVPGTSSPAVVQAEITRLALEGTTVAIVLGGTGVVSEAVETALEVLVE